MLAKAVEARASDIYLDIRRETAILSFRIFGVIQRIEEFDVEIARSVARGMWNRSGHSQWVESDPVDTAFTYDHEGHEYRIRGSSLKDTRGNSIVCRVRDPGYILATGKKRLQQPPGFVDQTDLHGAGRTDPDYRGDEFR